MAAPALIADGSASSAPLVIRSFVEREEDEAEEGALAAFVADEDDKVPEDACSAVCATHYIAGAKTEREALCSPRGLQNTRKSAWQCCICGNELTVTWCSGLRALHRQHMAGYNVARERNGRVRANRRGLRAGPTEVSRVART